MFTVKWLDYMWQLHETKIKAKSKDLAERMVWEQNANCINIMRTEKEKYL